MIPFFLRYAVLWCYGAVQILERYRAIARVKGSMSQDDKINRIKKVTGHLKIVLNASYMTVTWKSPTWQLHSSFMTVTWQFHDSHMAVTRHLHDSYMTVTCLTFS